VSASAQPPEVRRATSADVPALAKMLARAFLDDPIASWAFRPDALRLEALERFQEIRLRQMIVHEEVWTTADLTSAGLWGPAGHWRKTPVEDAAFVPCFAHPRLIARLPLVALGWHNMERRHPSKPEHWYLAVLGTDPSSQGQGLGSTVLQTVLSQLDLDAVGAYLECSKESNIDFYARHGFRVTDELRLLRGPAVWTMWRDPRS
jgi:ribosomal protein S18 acetylase RimI-like enzyme